MTEIQNEDTVILNEVKDLLCKASSLLSHKFIICFDLWKNKPWTTCYAWHSKNS